jgi:cysteinyl-tRNA synthetase
MSGNDEVFTPSGKVVRMYNCGPTVYGVQHIGNLSMFVFTDILRRTLEWNGHTVKQVINITDVGHLTSDADDGDDKMTKGLQREGMALTLENMSKLAEKYTLLWQEDLRALGINTDIISFPRATAHIHGQIALIQTLYEKGYAYKTKDGMYFDTALFKEYGKLGNIKLDALKEGARVDGNSDKRNPHDFALWKFNPTMGWDTPWGKGFPGWHIECSAMAHRELGEQLDIHTGGIEHIPVHHNNEIAQSEAAFGKKPFSRFWLHRAHLQIDGAKIAKSDGNVVYLSDIVEKGIEPLALRYWLLTAHYRQPTNFTYEALEGAQTALRKLRAVAQKSEPGTPSPHHVRRFHEALNQDLNTPKAIASLWDMLKDTAVTEADKVATLRKVDTVLGLDLAHGISSHKGAQTVDALAVPEEVASLLAARKVARDTKEWKESDRLRDEIKALGFGVTDTPDGGQHLSTL